MASLPFNIPSQREDLLIITNASYCVRDVLDITDITTNLKVAKDCFNKDGPAFILENFDIYYSILHQSKQLSKNVLVQAYTYLQQSLSDMPQVIVQTLEDSRSILNDEEKMQWQNIINMHIFIYVELTHVLNTNALDVRDTSLRVTGKSKARTSTGDEFDWYKCIKIVQRVLECELLTIWNRLPGPLTNKITELCFSFLENHSKKKNTDILERVWTVCGILMGKYNISETLVLRFVLAIKEQEHVASLFADGIYYMINTFRMQGIYKDLIRELIEWQISETNTESNSVKHCCRVVFDMSVKLPDLVIPELKYLNTYLNFTSYNLRNMVLSIQVELLLAKLTREDLSDDDRKLRDDILQCLLLHAFDKSTFVRAKIMQHYARLQEENAIPKNIIPKMLDKCVVLLQDVTANVRKNAIACIKTMLTHNLYGPVLSLRNFENKLQNVQEELVKLKYDMFGLDMEEQEAKEALWLERVDDIKSYLNKCIEKEDHNEDADKENVSVVENSQANSESQDTTTSMNMREIILAKNYRKAFEVCRERAKDGLIKKIISENEDSSHLEMVDHYAGLIYFLFMEVADMQIEGVTEEQYINLSTLENAVDYLNCAIQFCKLLAETCVLINQLLNSVNIGDMQESAEFVLVAYQFQLDDRLTLISNVLTVIVRNDPARQKVVLNVLKKAYLITDFTGESHSTTIVERLIQLLFSITHDRVDSLQLLMSQWAEQGMLGNDIFDMLWKYYLRSIDVPGDKARAALILLRMAAHGKDSIIRKNYNVVASKCFQDCKNNNIQLVTESFKFLSIMSEGETDIASKTARFRIPYEDEIWENIPAAMQELFKNKSRFVNITISSCVRLIFDLCSKPFPVVGKLLANFLDANKDCPMYMLVRFNILIGEIILNYMIFLDNDVYKEMKRRQHIINERKNQTRRSSSMDLNTSIKSLNTPTASQFQRNRNLGSTPSDKDVDKNDSIMEGAEAVDEDADIIMHQLESSIGPESMLGPYFARIVDICRHPQVYTNEAVQNSAITALLRGMLISAAVCEANIKLVFKILMKTTFVQNKITILIHMVDLLEKSPNIIEPYSEKLYILLNDETLKVREVVLKILALLILKDMIRPQENLWRLARCTIDPIPDISEPAKAFFVQSVQKSNNLYNYLPDIFSNLYTNTSVEELRSILDFLFELIQVPKQIETLVERFCIKFENITDEALATNITFALSHMKYSERALQKLIDNFPKFKHFILVDGIYDYFNQIVVTTCKAHNQKKEVKELTAQFEDLMNAVRDASDKPREMASTKNKFKRPFPASSTNIAKSKRGKQTVKTTQKRRQSPTHSSSEDDDDDVGPVRRTARRTRSKLRP